MGLGRALPLSYNTDAQHFKHLIHRELDASERYVTKDERAEASVETSPDTFSQPYISDSIRRSIISSKLHVLLNYFEGASHEGLEGLGEARGDQVLDMYI